MAYKYVTNRDAKNFTPGYLVQATFGYPRIITNITLHWWGKPEWGQTWDQVMAFFCDSPTVGTSAHEVISDGIVGCIVDHSAAAWANGNAKGNAQSITLECNPRMSEGDMNTVAERIADIWREHGRIIPLTEHRDWFSTECSGTWSKGEMTRRAMAYYNGGGGSQKDWFDMATKQELEEVVFNTKRPEFGGRTLAEAVREIDQNTWAGVRMVKVLFNQFRVGIPHRMKDGSLAVGLRKLLGYSDDAQGDARKTEFDQDAQAMYRNFPN